MERKRISWDEHSNIAWLGFGYQCNKPMTVLDMETMEELASIIEQLKKSSHLKGAVFFSHKERCFLAGADINMIDGFEKESVATEASAQGQSLFNQIESLNFPTVACIHGVCLGGGTEFALACKQIIVSDDPQTQMGLPEVKLGLLPGMGERGGCPKKLASPKLLR